MILTVLTWGPLEAGSARVWGCPGRVFHSQLKAKAPRGPSASPSPAPAARPLGAQPRPGTGSVSARSSAGCAQRGAHSPSFRRRSNHHSGAGDPGRCVAGAYAVHGGSSPHSRTLEKRCFVPWAPGSATLPAEIICGPAVWMRGRPAHGRPAGWREARPGPAPRQPRRTEVPVLQG